MRSRHSERSPRSRSPYGSPVGTTLGWRRLVRTTRNLLVVAVVGAAFIDYVGEPLLRWEYRYHDRATGAKVLDATYVGVSGRRFVRAGETDGDCPVILFAKPAPPLWRRATDRIASWAPAILR